MKGNKENNKEVTVNPKYKQYFKEHHQIHGDIKSPRIDDIETVNKLISIPWVRDLK